MSEPTLETHWPCACVKRGRDGKLSHIKMNPVSRKRCPVCKCKPLPDDQHRGVK